MPSDKPFLLAKVPVRGLKLSTAQALVQSAVVGLIQRLPSSSWRRRRPTAERYGRCAAALPHSSRTKVVAMKSARAAANSVKQSGE